MKRITQLKDEALDALHGNFGKAALASLGYVVVSIAFSMIFQLISGTNIMDYYEALLTNDTEALMEAMGGNIYGTILQFLGALLFTAPLAVGISNAYRVLFESKGADNAIFSNFFKQGFGKHYLHIVFVNFIAGILVALILIPAIIIFVLIGLIFKSGIVAVILTIAALVYCIWIGLMYSQITFILVDSPELDIIDTMRRSRTLMNGNKWRYFLLVLSFLGWIILGIFTLGIGYLWLLPYIHTTESAFYCEIRDAEKTAE
jgi:uncharacterized membrane protein